jgi:diacylglycerol kinase (ATP)
MPLKKRKMAFIVNPNAGMQSVGKEWPHIEKKAKDRLGPFQVHLTKGPGDATRFARRAIVEGVELIVCIGGDGTLNEVVNGFMGESGPIRPETILGFVPRGTGCDFIKTVSIPRETEAAIDLIKSGNAHPIDLGRVEYIDHQGQPARRYFHNVTSFGLGGEVDERVNRSTKLFGGFISFIWATLISLMIYQKKRIRLKVDEDDFREMTSWNVVVANGQYHGGGMWVAPEAIVNDGFFHVTIIGNFTLPEVFWHLPKLYNGRLLQLKKVHSHVAKKIEAHSDQRVMIDMDGEQPGHLPIRIEIIPGAIRLMMADLS